MTSSTRPSAFGGTMIIAGTTIGAGMFSIPVVTSGVWFTGSVMLLIFTWAAMLISGLFILETNLHYPSGASFPTMVKDLLGKRWNLLNNISIAFVLYILTYAYISAGGSILSQTLSHDHRIAALLFALVIAFVVWLSTKAVDRLSTVLIGGMLLTFVFSISDLFGHASLDILLDNVSTNHHYAPYALIALPYLLTSFGYHGNIPGLVKYYRHQSKPVVQSLFFGTLCALLTYIAWQYAIQGNISRSSFTVIIAEGGNINSLLNQINIAIDTPLLSRVLNAFSYMALTSSFLGVSLGLFDFIADLFKQNDTHKGRATSALITFLPPTLFALAFPNGFIYAIGFAGLAATIWAVIVPALMVRKSRLRHTSTPFTVLGGKAVIAFTLLFGLVTLFIHLAALANLLPSYK